jgi:type IV pilus assembly protein PilM
MEIDSKKFLSNFVNSMKDTLKLGNRSIVGVDVGLSAVKIAQIEGNKESNEYELINYVSVPLPEGAIIEDEIQNEDEIVEAINKGMAKIKSPTDLICLGISGPNTVVRRLQLAGGSDEEIEDQVIWEAEQYLPFEIEESAVSFHIMGENEGGGVDVLVAAAKNTVLEQYKAIMEKAELRIKIIDLGIISVVNIFELAMGEKLDEQGQSFLIIDLGAQKTEFIIYKNNMIVFSKEITVGGIMITEEIQRQMGVNYYEAEDLKITGDENGNLPEEILEIIDDVIESFFSEIKKTIDFYISSTSDESLVGCYVTGGSSLIPGIIEGLEALLGVDVGVLNPFEAISYSEKNFSDQEINEIAYRGATVLGLAMREL